MHGYALDREMLFLEAQIQGVICIKRSITFWQRSWCLTLNIQPNRYLDIFPDTFLCFLEPVRGEFLECSQFLDLTLWNECLTSFCSRKKFYRKIC